MACFSIGFYKKAYELHRERGGTHSAFVQSNKLDESTAEKLRTEFEGRRKRPAPIQLPSQPQAAQAR